MILPRSFTSYTLSSVYVLENVINGRAYVGKSDDVERRWRGHQHDARVQRYPIQRAIHKYGADAFVVHVVESDLTSEEALRREVEWIAYLRSMGVRLYNVTDGGEGTSGLRRRLSPETCRRMSLARTGVKRKPFTEEHRENMRQAQLKRPKCSDATREKLRVAAKRQHARVV